MERVLGIGGVFFKARDPKALAAWYREHLGVPVEPEQTYGAFTSAEAGEQAVWSAFPADTSYFGSGPAPFMVNYRVGNLDALLADQGRPLSRVEPFCLRFPWNIRASASTRANSILDLAGNTLQPLAESVSLPERPISALSEVTPCLSSVPAGRSSK